ncbi:MAG: hypothetical protein IBJ13_06285 [Sphingopyxis sp.]|nr:hypothetical protein [Sphingopyxis sp.]
MPVLILAFAGMVSSGDYEGKDVAVIGGVILLSILCFWWAHQDRREAEPLVRFLRDALTGAGRSLRAASERVTLSDGLTLDVSGQRAREPTSVTAIHDALVGLGEGDSVVLEAAPELYIQTLSRNGSFIVEMRREPGQHFQAVRRNTPNTKFERFHFTFEETLTAFLAFGSGTEGPPILDWIPMSSSD